MTMKIMFICSDQNHNNGEEYTPEMIFYSTIEGAAKIVSELDDAIQAIDIADLSDVEDVTTLVAVAYVEDLHSEGALAEDLPRYVIGIDMNDLVQELAEKEESETIFRRQVEKEYYAGRL